jgi:ABC-type glycerol-3-phosphate transport system substrate-binding protein
MFKRVIMLIALGAALVACSPAGGSSADPSVDAAPVESPVESMEASPSAS